MAGIDSLEDLDLNFSEEDLDSLSQQNNLCKAERMSDQLFNAYTLAEKQFMALASEKELYALLSEDIQDYVSLKSAGETRPSFPLTELFLEILPIVFSPSSIDRDLLLSIGEKYLILKESFNG
jgi:hypothetical protein